MDEQGAVTAINVLGICAILFGVLMGLLGTAALVGVFLFSSEFPEAILVIAFMVFAGILLVMGLSYVVIGIGVVRKKKWSRVPMIVLSAVSLMNVPIGTLFGAFGLWMFAFDDNVHLILTR